MKTRLILLSILITGLMTGCQSVDKMIDTGDFDDAIVKSHKKLRGKKHKREKYVRAIEEAFTKATQKDMRRIEVLKSRGSAADWEEIIDIAYRIESRQDLVRPYLPLVAKEGYKASFKFVRSEEIMDVAYANMVTRLYEEGSDYLAQGREGDKFAAREAHELFQKLLEHTADYRDAFSLMKEARDLGTNHIRIVQKNAANTWIPDYLAGRILGEFAVNDDYWTKFHFGADTGRHADVEAILTITGVEVGPQAMREDVDRRSRRIEDGWEYVLDENGNVAKDSTGNDIRRTKYTTVRADVIRTTQEKIAYVRAEFKAVDLSTGRILATKPLNGTAQFAHTARWFVGDERALRGNDRRYIGLEPFPSDEQLIIQAADALKPLFLRELRRDYYAS